MTDEEKSDEESAEVARARAIILARRNKLMTAAMAGLGMVGVSCSKVSVCLSIAPPGDAGEQRDGGEQRPDAGPSVCLSIMPADAGMDSGPTLDAAQEPDDASVEDAGPRVCLSLPFLHDHDEDPTG